MIELRSSDLASFFKSNYYRKILIIGLPGSGKTTLGKKIEEQLKIPHYEMDRLLWVDSKGGAIRDDFLNEVRQILKKDQWIIEGQLRRISHLIHEVDLLIKITPAKKLLLKRLIQRDLQEFVKRKRTTSDFIFVLKDLLKGSKKRRMTEEQVTRCSKKKIHLV